MRISHPILPGVRVSYRVGGRSSRGGGGDGGNYRTRPWTEADEAAFVAEYAGSRKVLPWVIGFLLGGAALVGALVLLWHLAVPHTPEDIAQAKADCVAEKVAQYHDRYNVNTDSLVAGFELTCASDYEPWKS